MRILLPGLAVPPDDYAALIASLDGPTRVLDTLRMPVTAEIALIRSALEVGPGPHELIGHSIGALIALEWALRWPDELSRLVLLDPSDPWSAPVWPVLGGAPGAVLRATVSAAALIPALARALGRRGRRSLLAMYGVHHDPLGRQRIDALFATRAALGAITRQVTDVPRTVARVERLLDGPFTPPPTRVIASCTRPGVLAPATVRLCTQLDAELFTLQAGHLFPMTHPSDTATLIAQ